MICKYIIPLETPSKKNSRITSRRTGRSFPSKRYAEWHKQALAVVASQGVPDEPIAGKLYVRGLFRRGDRRRRDNNNSGASILDMLVDAGVLADDNCEIVCDERWTSIGVRKGQPMAIIYIDEFVPVSLD